MRPRRLTVDHLGEIEGAADRLQSFNEATAFNRGSLIRRVSHWFGPHSFNEATAFNRGSPPLPNEQISALLASMRPRRLTVDHQTHHYDKYEAWSSFNEATAFNRGSPVGRVLGIVTVSGLQ